MGGAKAGALETPPSLATRLLFFRSFRSKLIYPRLDSNAMRRHGALLNDLASTMSGVGAGAVLSGSGADHELRWWKLGWLYDCSKFQVSRRAQRMSWTKATPTPICTPIVSRAFIESTAPGSNTVQFNAQGIFDLQNGSAKEKFNDVTNAANILWNPGQPNADFTGGITASGETNGEFIGTKEGCAYFVVSLSGFSQDVVIGVGVDPLSCPPAPGSQ
jgi:hypothetical protein